MKSPSPRLSVVVPAYNAEDNLEPLTTELHCVLPRLRTEWDVERVFVDDDSFRLIHFAAPTPIRTHPAVDSGEHCEEAAGRDHPSSQPLNGRSPRRPLPRPAHQGRPRELGRYLSASVLGTAAHYSLMTGLVHLTSLGKVAASTCGALLGAAIIYVLNYYVTFRSTARHQVAALRFSLVAASSVALNAFVLKSLLAWLGWHYLSLQAITTLTVFGLSYIASRTWAF